MFPERDRLSGGRAQIDLVEFTQLKAYLATGRLEEARQPVDRSRGPRGISVARLDALSFSGRTDVKQLWTEETLG